MTLRVINGGPAGGQGPRRRKRPVMDAQVQALLQSLPAPSISEISKRMSVLLGRTILDGTTTQVIRYVRQNAAELGWTVHYAERGPNLVWSDRFVAVLMRKDGTTQNDDEEIATHNGLVTTLNVLRATNDRQIAMLHAVANHTAGRKLPRVLRGIITDMEHASSKIVDALDDLSEA